MSNLNKDVSIKLDINAIKNSPLQKTPFHYNLIKNLLSFEDIQSLLAHLPLSNFFLSSRAEGSDKAYQVLNKILIPLSQRKTMMDPELPVIWQNLIIQLQSKAYIDALEHACGLQLSDAYQEITLKRYGHNHYISSHTDKEEVRATHMIFLNEHWEKEWGGELCFLNSNQEITNQFTPTYQQSVFFIRSENSWHSVNKIIHHNEERIAIQVAFWNTTQRTVLPGRQTVYI